MNNSEIFLIGIALTTCIALAVVIYLRPHLSTLLTELCGNRDRAAFWAAFSNTTILLVPIIFALNFRPEPDVERVFEVASQLEWGLGGLVLSVILMGIVIGRFIPRVAPKG
jgi:hypothetical protein